MSEGTLRVIFVFSKSKSLFEIGVEGLMLNCIWTRSPKRFESITISNGKIIITYS